MNICLLNETKSFFFLFFQVITLFHYSPAGKKRAYLKKLPLYVFWENKGIMLQTLRGKQKYQITNGGIEKIKLSRLLVQRINEFKMNKIQRKSPQ